MSPRFLGGSIREAIDWTQDKLCSTRPVAETVLFSLLADRKAVETEAGFLLEADDAEIEKRSRGRARHRPRFKFHTKRKTGLFQHQGSSFSDEAGDMEDADDDNKQDFQSKLRQIHTEGWFL